MISLRTLKYILPGLIVAANVTSADLDDLKHPFSVVQYAVIRVGKGIY